MEAHISNELGKCLLAIVQDPRRPACRHKGPLHGTRDATFGIQVVGHTICVHPLLQRRPGTLRVLDHGKVFLASLEAQDGATIAMTISTKLKGPTADTSPVAAIKFTVADFGTNDQHGLVKT